MAAPTVIGKGTTGSGTGLIAAPGYPANPQANDVIWLLAISHQPNSIGVISTSAVGFTQAAQGTYQNNALANQGRIGLWWKRAAGGESGTINVDRTGDTGTNDTSFLTQLYLTRNHIQTGSPYENLTARYGPGGASVVWDAVTVTGASTLVLAFVGQADNLSNVQPPTGYTALATDTTAAGTDSEVRLCYANDSASAPQTSGTGGETEGWGSFHLSAPPIPTQSLTATGLPTEENLGAPQLTFSITPTGIVGGESIGVHDIATAGPGAQSITPTGIPTQESIGAHSFSTNIAPTGMPTGESVGAHTISIPTLSGIDSSNKRASAGNTIPIIIYPIPDGTIDDSDRQQTTGLYAGVPIELGGAGNIIPTGIPTAESIGVHTFGLNISVTGIPSDEQVGAHALGLNIAPTGIPSEESIGVSKFDLNISATGIPSDESIGAHTISTTGGAQTITATGIPTNESVGAHSFATNVSAIGIPTEESIGAHSLRTNISVTGVPSDESVGIHTFGLNITPAGIPTSESVGIHAFGLNITPTGIPTQESVGAHSLTLNIAPTGIASGESVGTHSFATNISVTGIPTEESVGAHTISAVSGAQAITPTGISSDESVGAHAFGLNVSATGVPSSELVGAHRFSLSTIPSGISSDEAIGVVSFGLNISVTGIVSDESIGAHQFAGGTSTITVTGIESAESIGIHIIALVTPEPEPEPVAISGGGPEGRIRRKRHPQVYITSTELEDEEIVAILN